LTFKRDLEKHRREETDGPATFLDHRPKAEEEAKGAVINKQKLMKKNFRHALLRPKCWNKNSPSRRSQT